MKKLILILLFLILAVDICRCEDNSANVLNLDLKKCIEMSINNDLSLKQADKDVSISEAIVRKATSGLYPNLSLTTSYSRRNQVPSMKFPGGSEINLLDVNQHDVTLSCKYLIYDGGGVRSIKSQAEANLEATVINEEKVRQDVIYKTAFAYFSSLKARYMLIVSKEAVDLSNSQLELANKRFDAGTVAKADVLKAESQLADAKINLIEAQNMYNISLVALNDIIGISLNTPVELTENYNYDKWQVKLEDCSERAKENRLEINILEKMMESSSFAIEFAKSSWYPDIFFKLDYTPWGNSLMATDNTLVATVGLQVNIFDGFNTSAGVDEAKSRYDKVNLQMEDVIKKINLDVTKSFLTFTSSSDKVLEAEKSVEAAKESYRVAQISYREGISPFIDVNQAQLALTGAEKNKVHALYDYYISRVELLRAMGLLGKGDNFWQTSNIQ